MRHLTAFERVAVVTDTEWLAKMVKAFGFVMPCEVRVFHEDELKDARSWVAEEVSFGKIIGNGVKLRLMAGVWALVVCLLIVPGTTVAQDSNSESGNSAAAGAGGAAAELARKLQNPLANIKAIMTDNAIGFNTGNDEGTSYGFQVQPVYAIDFPERGFTFLPRAVIPILGLEPGTDVPRVGQPGPQRGSSIWGLGDMVVQAFFAPHTKRKWKWGAGPQFSLGTATDSQLRGPHWGAGVAGVITGDITPNLSFAGIVGNLWSFNGNFNTGMIQPMLFYNIPAFPGTSLSYNAPIALDWEASSSNAWTVPLGLSVGRAFDMGNGNGLSIALGPYYNVERPKGAADWLLRFGITWLFP